MIDKYYMLPDSCNEMSKSYQIVNLIKLDISKHHIYLLNPPI